MKTTLLRSSVITLLSFFLMSCVMCVLAQNVVINKKWLEHNVTLNGVKGMKIHVDFNVNDMKGKQGKVLVYFENPKGTGLKDQNGKYCTTNGKVCVSETFTPRYDNSHYSDFDIFMPINEIHMKRGKFTYYCDIRVMDVSSGNFLNDETYLSFTGTSQDDNTNKQYANSAQSSSSSGNLGSSPIHGKILKEENELDSNGTGVMRTYYADGYTLAITILKCSCNNGKCFFCGGSGLGMMGMNCPICYGSGKCSYCHGSGKFVTSSGYYSNSFSGGSVGSSSNGSSGSYSSGSSGSSHSRRTCPGCGGTGKGTDQITYAPNYTGHDNSRYCSECGRVMAAHSHHRPICRVCNGRGYVE